MLHEHEELTIDEGTISLSSNYSQEYALIFNDTLSPPLNLVKLLILIGVLVVKLLLLTWNRLLTALSQALQSSGIDLSQASISVQINLGKRASNKRSDTTGTAYTPQVFIIVIVMFFLLLSIFWGIISLPILWHLAPLAW